MGLTTDQALRAVTSVGSRRILAYSGGREGLDALVVRRHEVLSSAGAVSLGDLRAATLAVRRRFGVGAGPGESVELAGAVLKRLFPAGVGVVGAEGAAGASSGSVVDRLMPGVPWTGVSAMSEVVGALGEAGRGAVVVLWAQEVQAAQDDMGEFTLFVRLDPDPGDGQMRIALVDPRAVPPVEALPEREWAGVSGQSRTWVDTGVETRMIVLDGTGW